MPIGPGTRLGRYAIDSLLGRGGMGEVWRARDTELDRDVAIKVLPADLTNDPERLARLEREARVLASLDHASIAAIYGIESAEGSKCLVMQLAGGEELAARLARGPLPVPEAVAVAIQIAEGLEAAHEAGVVHRDLKPANVKVSEDGRVKLLDFGLAKAIEATSDGRDTSLSNSPTLLAAATHAGVILGTAAYMSPEQASGRPVDRRTDIWAFGVVLFEMLTGAPLFRGETLSEILACVLKEAPDLDRLPASTPAHVRRLIERCLVRDPRMRLRDIGEARIALAAGTDDEAIAGPSLASGSPRRERVAWALAGLAGALALAFLLWPARPPETRRPLRKFDLATAAVSTWMFAPVISPDGSRIAYTTGDAIWVRDLDRLEPRRLAEVTSPSFVFWSADARQVGYVAQKGLWRVGVEGGRSVSICDLPGAGGAIGAVWAPDDVITFASWRGGLYTVPAEGGAPSELLPIDPDVEVDFHHLARLPGGELVFLVHRLLDDGRGLEVYDGSERRPLDPIVAGEIEWLTYASGHLLFVADQSSPGVWALPFDAERVEPRGEAFLVAPGAGGVSASNDGALLYVERSTGADELVWVDRSGRPETIVVGPTPGLAGPALSPDGSRIAYTARVDANVELFAVDSAGGKAARLTFTDAQEAWPRWVGDDRLVHGEVRDIVRSIVSRPLEVGGAPQVLMGGERASLNAGAAAISPDGRWLIHAQDERGRGTLLVAPVSNGQPGESRPLLQIDPQPNVREARVSPDGRLIAWVSDESGEPELYVSTFPDGRGRWQVSTAEGYLPRWASRSGELFFVGGGGAGAGRSLMVARVSTAPAISIGTPSIVFPLSESSGAALHFYVGFDVAPDGQRFVMAREAGGAAAASGRMVLVQNWLEEFAEP